MAAQVDKSPWQVAPNLSEQIYSMEDSLLFASMLMNFLKYADRIKIACQSLLTNISAAIMTEKGGGVWVQPIFYPFSYTSRYGRGTVLSEVFDCPSYACERFGEVPYVDSVTVYNEEEQEVVFFLVNRSEDESICFECELQGFEIKEITEQVTMSCEDKKMTNLIRHDAVEPRRITGGKVEGNRLVCELAPLSWNMIRAAERI